MLEERYMRLALQFAEAVKQQTSPNPPVGAVIVKNGTIVGLGAHLKPGEAHAEVHALQMAGKRANGATLYVTLEPCCHVGKTPPCTEQIIKSGIKRVVIATKDHHEMVSGGGIEKLKKARIAVEVGVLQEEAERLYEPFFHYVTNKRPFVTVKAAVSLDGKTATKKRDSKWITNESARKDAHQYRHEHDAILVGVNTVINDNPRLTTRLSGGKNPHRIILDTTLRTPLDANVVSGAEAETWIITNCHVTEEQKIPYEQFPHVHIYPLDSPTIHLPEVMSFLYEKGIMSLYVEGGATIHSSFLKARLIDRLIIYIAPSIIGGKEAPNMFQHYGVHHLIDAYQMQLEEVKTLDGQIKVVAKRSEAVCLPD